MNKGPCLECDLFREADGEVYADPYCRMFGTLDCWLDADGDTTSPRGWGALKCLDDTA